MSKVIEIYDRSTKATVETIDCGNDDDATVARTQAAVRQQMNIVDFGTRIVAARPKSGH